MTTTKAGTRRGEEPRSTARLVRILGLLVGAIGAALSIGSCGRTSVSVNPETNLAWSGIWVACSASGGPYSGPGQLSIGLYLAKNLAERDFCACTRESAQLGNTWQPGTWVSDADSVTIYWKDGLSISLVAQDGLLCWADSRLRRLPQTIYFRKYSEVEHWGR